MDNAKLHIYFSDVEGKPAICFDTGLDPRSFARTKMSQALVESGYVVYPDGSSEAWKASGIDEVNGSMRVWGAAFTGKRLDSLINEADSQERQSLALQAVVFWLRAKMFLGEKKSTLNTAAAFICLEEGNNYPRGSVFFTPQDLSDRCLLMEGTEVDHFNCPDLEGMDAAAFCAGVILYKILSKSFPYQNEKTFFQDIREGVFLAVHLAVPGLKKELCQFIQSALLLPVEYENLSENGIDIISGILNCLKENENHIISVSLLFEELPAEEQAKLEKEKRNYLLKQNTYTKAKFFVANNKNAVIGVTAGLLLVVFVIASTIQSFHNRPTTAGMDPHTVIMTYFDAFSSLDHTLMEACIQGADKSDINAAATLYVINKTREAYERTTDASIVPAKTWIESGGELPAPNVFGVTDLSIQYLSGSYEDNMMKYRAKYLFWSPDADYAINRNDTITLERDKRENWRITEILREEKIN